MPKETTVRTTVLLPESLYAALKRIADDEQRSTHRQIIYALQKFVEDRRPQPAPAEGSEG